MNDNLRRVLWIAGGIAGAWIAVRALGGGVRRNPVTFASGLSRSPKDATKLIKKSRPIGVSMLDPLSRTMRKQLISYANAGGKIFLDSGAFTAAGRGKRMNWPEILFSYREIINNIRPQNRQNVWIVAPDVVGSAKKTWALNQKLAEEIQPFIDGGVQVIIPAQKGRFRDISRSILDIEVLYDFGTCDKITVGIPYNKAAWKQKDVMKYVDVQHRNNTIMKKFGQEPIPIKIHLLGAGEKKAAELEHKFAEKGYKVDLVTSDAMFPEISIRKKRR